MLDFLLQKGFDEDTRFGKILREGAALVKGIRTPAVSVTTSEPPGGNAGTGPPVTAAMSGGLAPQPGWNRGILNCIPPLIFQGWDFVYLLPPI